MSKLVLRQAERYFEQVEPAEDANESLTRFLIGQRLVPAEVASTSLQWVQERNAYRTIEVPAASLIDEICQRGHADLEALLETIIERTNADYVPLEHYVVDRAIAQMIPATFAMSHLVVPFDVIGQTTMIAMANPFDVQAKNVIEEHLDCDIQWHLASPRALSKVLGENLRADCQHAVSEWMKIHTQNTQRRSERLAEAARGNHKSFSERVADLLVEEGLLQPSQLTEALTIQRNGGGRLLKLIADRGYVAEENLAVAMGRCLNVSPVNLSKIRVPQEVRDLVPKEIARQYKLAPVCRLGKRLYVAMADPQDVPAMDDLRQRTKLKIVPMIATERSVIRHLNSAGVKVEMALAMESTASETEPVEQLREQREEIDPDRVAADSEDAPAVKIVNLILLQALHEKASDVHIEPFEKHIKLRFRVDGALVDGPAPPKALQLCIASRIKVLAGLNIAERRLPQDGRFSIRVYNKEVDLRVSFAPTVYGEKIVIRILEKTVCGPISQLGMDEHTFRTFKKAVDAPHGMLLVTGPTGSGKTTTLYSILSELNKSDSNIVTVEDPVEYRFAGINQIPVKPEIGLSFADALRCILRQDPDIVMVGEIRDGITADIAVKAALTGHQVLSTLHTNDAAGAITRLVDMGVEPFLISSSVLLTCAQRLIRRVCPNCREEISPPPEIIDKLHLESNGSIFCHGAGCDQCNRLGYVGRTAVLEVLPVSEPIRRLIMRREPSDVIKNQAIEEGMKTLRMACIEKAKAGITTLEEVLRMTESD